MARMTPQEADAVNIVCSYLAGRGDGLPREVAGALELLASRAHNRIQTGWDEDAVRRQWPEMQHGPTADYGDDPTPTAWGVRGQILAAIDAIVTRSGSPTFALNDVLVEMRRRNTGLRRIDGADHGHLPHVRERARPRRQDLRRPRASRRGLYRRR